MKLTLETATLLNGFFTWNFPTMKYRYQIIVITTEVDFALKSYCSNVGQLIMTNKSNDECDYTFEDDKLSIEFTKFDLNKTQFTDFIALEIEVTGI